MDTFRDATPHRSAPAREGGDGAGRIMACASVCEVARPDASAEDLEGLLERTCRETGLPACERVYAGSYFCDQYFLALDARFHEALRMLCARHDLPATLVVPIAGQSRLTRMERRAGELVERFGDVYDEVVVNDVGCFMELAGHAGARLGIGRLFARELRDARYPEELGRVSRPALSPEAIACVRARAHMRPLVDVDPVSAVVDVSGIADAAPGAEIAVHFPYCFATTGRTCSPASAALPDSEKFRPASACQLECLRLSQGSRVEGGTRYVKWGRTCLFPNPGCSIAGAGSWRIVCSAMAALQPRGTWER